MPRHAYAVIQLLTTPGRVYACLGRPSQRLCRVLLFERSANPMTCGIYSITNAKSKKRYIGSAIDLDVRWRSHLRALRGGVHHSRHLQAAWNKYGEAEFIFELVATCEPEQLIEQEQFWIDAFQTANGKHGYNVSPTAGSPLGVKHTAETRAKISAVQLGKKATPETKAKMSASRRAFLAQPGALEKTANAQREVMARPGMKERIAAATRNALARPGMREKLSMIARVSLSRPEVREKLSAARRGRKLTDETRANMSLAQREVWERPELRAKQAAAQLGENNSYAKLTADDVREIRKLLAAGVLQKEIAARFGVSKGAITDINRGKNWGHVK